MPFGTCVLRPLPSDTEVAVPLDPRAPWPKFRGNALQNGRASFAPRRGEGRPWQFHTGKGIFSSPVIDGEGTVYVGSADHHFYAIGADGQLRWRFATGEVIDSAALLDDRGRVYFGSGDGHLYALDRRDGRLVWRVRAHTTAQVKKQFGLTTYNLDWFEGNVAMLPDGSLLAPNDNYLVYRVGRDGRMVGQLVGNELMWSLPAVNPRTSRVFLRSGFRRVTVRADLRGRTPLRVHLMVDTSPVLRAEGEVHPITHAHAIGHADTDASLYCAHGSPAPSRRGPGRRRSP